MSLTDGKGATVPLADALDATVARLTAAGRRVVLVDDVPSFRFDPYSRVVGDMRQGSDSAVPGGRGKVANLDQVLPPSSL